MAFIFVNALTYHYESFSTNQSIFFIDFLSNKHKELYVH